MAPSLAGGSRRLSALGVVVVCVVGLLAGCTGIPGIYTVEPSGAGTGADGDPSRAFDADAFVAGIWDSKVVPTATTKAIAADELFAALETDPDATSKRYGRQAGSGAPYTFLVKGTGTVTAVSEGDAVGRIRVAIPGVPTVTVDLAVGPAFVSTAVRDSMDFIDFSQFVNQLDYAAAATALNARVKSGVVNTVDPSTIKGRTVTFVGAFQLVDPASVLVTPIVLTVSP